MSYAVITTKVDPQTKKHAQKIAEEIGVPLSVVIKAMLKDFIRTKSLTIGVHDEEPSAYLKRVIRQAEKNWKEGKHSPMLKTGEEAVRWLNQQGI